MFRYSYKYVLSLDIVSVFCTAFGNVYTCIGSTYSVGTISATILRYYERLCASFLCLYVIYNVHLYVRLNQVRNEKVKHLNKLCLFSVCKERPGTYIRPAERHYNPNSWTNIVSTRHQTSCTFHAHSTGMLIVNIQTPKISPK